MSQYFTSILMEDRGFSKLVHLNNKNGKKILKQQIMQVWTDAHLVH